MIRFIDLRHREEDIDGARFAFWDTVTDSFIGNTAWTDFEDFAEDIIDSEFTERCRLITPPWAHTPARQRTVHPHSTPNPF